MKPHVYALGIDDAPFSFSDGHCHVFGVLMDQQWDVKAVMHTIIEVDGSDATDALCSLVEDSRYRDEIRVLMLDGIALGGMNIVDIDALHECTGLPVITITRNIPDLKQMLTALKAHRRDADDAAEVLVRHNIHEISIEMHGRKHSVFVNLAGITKADAAGYVRSFCRRTLVPEPIRLAHLIGAALQSGESRGRP